MDFMTALNNEHYNSVGKERELEEIQRFRASFDPEKYFKEEVAKNQEPKSLKNATDVILFYRKAELIDILLKHKGLNVDLYIREHILDLFKNKTKKQLAQEVLKIKKAR